MSKLILVLISVWTLGALGVEFGRNVSKSFFLRLERSVLEAIYFTVGQTVVKNDIEWDLLMHWRHNTTTINVTINRVIVNNNAQTQIVLR